MKSGSQNHMYIPIARFNKMVTDTTMDFTVDLGVYSRDFLKGEYIIDG